MSSAAGAMNWVETYLRSTVGRKILVALTGLGLATFVVFHMIGNLKMFSGPESINHYASFLKHDLGALIWIARGGLLAIFAVHLFLTIRLKMRSAMARPVGYSYVQTAQATAASKSMIWTGIVIGAFVVYHLAHFTFGLTHEADGVNYLELRDSEGRHDVYRMVIAGFSAWHISLLYIVAQVLLFVHLSHGIQSALITLGLVGRRFGKAAKMLGLAVAGTILLGNLAIVLAVWTGFLT
jgi:succinate dehydrogenase / fumarate reductase cytochrome b subunit